MSEYKSGQFGLFVVIKVKRYVQHKISPDGILGEKLGKR